MARLMPSGRRPPHHRNPKSAAWVSSFRVWNADRKCQIVNRRRQGAVGLPGCRRTLHTSPFLFWRPHRMNMAAAMIYWLIVTIWLTVLTTVIAFYVRDPRTFGTTRLLLAVIAIDTSRNVFENVYFGLYFGGRYEIFPAVFAEVLGKPALLIVPKLANVAAGCVVLGLLLWRWLPAAIRERLKLDETATDLRTMAAIDGMTGLFNRRHFDLLAAAEWERFHRYRRPLSILIVDIDLFKSINDRYGHRVGDRVIVQIAAACRDQQRKPDIIARLGGEEFALLLPETELQGALTVAERLRDIISRNILAIQDDNIAVTVSIGVGEARAGSTLEDLLDDADMALYEAKGGGRNRVCCYERGNASKPTRVKVATMLPALDDTTP
jgi:diguanylate cyclase (GGDEF)-like protein